MSYSEITVFSGTRRLDLVLIAMRVRRTLSHRKIAARAVSEIQTPRKRTGIGREPQV